MKKLNSIILKAAAIAAVVCVVSLMGLYAITRYEASHTKYEMRLSYWDNYRINENWLSIAVHDDCGNIIERFEIPAEGNLDIMHAYWLTAPKGINEHNYQAFGFDRLIGGYSDGAICYIVADSFYRN